MKFYTSLFLFFICSVQAFAGHEGFIYGKITLKNKTVYWGKIKWSGGQVLWSDVLTVAKQTNHNLRYLSDSQVENLSREDAVEATDWQFMSLWKQNYPQRKSEALSRFGDIALIHVTGKNEAQIYYKNGYKVRAKTDENRTDQLGNPIIVFNEDGAKKLDWEAISTIKFYATPANLPNMKGNPLFGTVMTTKGALTGYIIWDQLKYSDSQSLSGSRDGERERYRFNSIHSIKKSEQGATVKLKSGKVIQLTSDRDVNSGNRGIVVMHPLWGRVVVGWKAFKSARFSEQTGVLGYNDYVRPKKIYTTVKTKDQKIIRGNGVFDLDEEWEYDLIEGEKDGISYQIPLSFVAKVIPFNAYYSKLVLKSGKVLFVGHHNDVTARNWGVLVWQANSRYTYLPWKNIEEIAIR